MKAGVITLRSIELAGFKSFAKRTNIEFGNGLVAIVGPNGSGKSNIADAVRWVFGEQSNKSLRGDKSEDLIYHGSDKTSRASMAEVTLRLDNSSGKIPLDLNEIEICRRLYRSGENSYLLNGRKTSLNSIQELLSKAGFGIGSYAVIGQGMIDKLILSSGAERKQLFEEASGVKQYEIKLNQTNRRLKVTQENLGQINALINDIKPEWEQLERQRGFLAKREALQNELQSKRLAFLLHNQESLQKKHQSLEIQHNNHLLSLSKVEKSLKYLEKSKPKQQQNFGSKVAMIESDLLQLDQQRSKLESEIYEISAKLQLIESSRGTPDTAKRISEDIDLAQSNIRENILVQKDLTKMVKSYDTKISLIDGKITNLTKQLDKSRRSLAKSQKTEYLRHCLGLIDILQDGIQKNKPYTDLNIIFYKLRRMLKHSIADDSTDLALQVGRMQNSISSLLGEKERLAEKQTAEIIKLRASEMDHKSITTHLAELQKKLKAISATKPDENKQYNSLSKIFHQLNAKRDTIIANSEAKRSDLVQMAKMGDDDLRDEYYEKHEQLIGEQLKVQAQLDQTKSSLEDNANQLRYIQGLSSQWFGPKLPKTEPFAGTVNMQELDRLNAAIDLYQNISPDVQSSADEISKRMEFLEKQRDDLIKAIDDLQKLLNRTSEDMRRLFEKSFARINSNFTKSFTKLFGGGHAALRLEAGDDNYGVEIEVQLPGKKIQNLSSLSGGEKALASVALLAAILQSNPSPFIVLDEVDAALDETNTQKFAQVIADITKHSQVLVITHNHETMAVASELLGVTTSGKNDSHILRVRLDNLPAGAIR